MTETKSNPLTSVVLLLLAIAFLAWPLAMGGCTPRFAGFEIGTWLGKVKVKPIPTEPITPPATRCLVFSATWCKYCGPQKRNINSMARSGWRIGPAKTDDIEILDVDGPDPRIKQFKARSLPTLVICDQSGKEISRREGLQTADALAEWIRSTRK